MNWELCSQNTMRPQMNKQQGKLKLCNILMDYKSFLIEAFFIYLAPSFCIAFVNKSFRGQRDGLVIKNAYCSQDPAPGDLMSSSGLSGYSHACVCIHTHINMSSSNKSYKEEITLAVITESPCWKDDTRLRKSKSAWTWGKDLPICIQ